jgi:XTP/dITP diphosphohydrolase
VKVAGPVVIASRNPGKLAELRALAGDGLELVPLPRTIAAMPEEEADTYLGNALLKARAAAAVTDGWVLADDSGLEVDGLDGAPGVHSARFGGAGLTDAERCRLLLDRLAKHAGGSPGRRARFRCILVLVREEECLTAEGVLEGEIALAPRGSGGFGYDPVFVAPGSSGRTLAELDPEMKDRISHRAVAMRNLLAQLSR